MSRLADATGSYINNSLQLCSSRFQQVPALYSEPGLNHSVFNTIFTVFPVRVELSKLCRWIGQHCDAVVTRAIAYHQQLCSTSLLHDADCHNWQSNRPFSEVESLTLILPFISFLQQLSFISIVQGERVSYTVQAWYFHMKALLHDLTNHTPSMYTTRITSEVLVHSVTMVTNYYMQLKPSSARIPQYR